MEPEVAATATRYKHPGDPAPFRVVCDYQPDGSKWRHLVVVGPGRVIEDRRYHLNWHAEEARWCRNRCLADLQVMHPELLPKLALHIRAYHPAADDRQIWHDTLEVRQGTGPLLPWDFGPSTHWRNFIGNWFVDHRGRLPKWGQITALDQHGNLHLLYMDEEGLPESDGLASCMQICPNNYCHDKDIFEFCVSAEAAWTSVGMGRQRKLYGTWLMGSRGWRHPMEDLAELVADGGTPSFL